MSFPYTLPGPPGLQTARTRYLRRSARLLLDWPHPLPAWLHHAWTGVRGPLATVLARHPRDFYAALSLPQVGAPLHARALAEAVPQLLVELSRRRVLGPEGVWWHGPVRRLISAPAGFSWEWAAEHAGLLFVDGEVEVSPGEAWAIDHGERAFHPLAEGGWLALVDNNPLAMVEAHPDKTGNALSLGTASAEEWVTTLDAARALIRLTLPDLAEEHRGLLAEVVPVGGPMEVSLSASYQEAIGVAYVSLHPNPLKLAEALIHEVQHNKLNLVRHMDDVLEDGDTRYASPVRPDPRPLWGVLLAAHAFLPVAELFAALDRMGHPLSHTDTFRIRWREVLEANHEAMEVVLAHAHPTRLGADIVAGMDRLERAQRGSAG